MEMNIQLIEQAAFAARAAAPGYVVVNNDKGSNWNVGASVTRCSPWEGGWAIFTDRDHPGVAISAHTTEVSAGVVPGRWFR